MDSPNPAPPSRVPWPPLLFFTALAIGLILQWLWPIAIWPGHRLWLAGIILIVTALTITLRAHHVMAAAHTTIRPDRASSALVTTGPFRFTRNPLYVALLLVLMGAGLILNSVWPLLAAVCLALALNAIVIPNEERHLRGLFPEPYAEYSRRVRRWI